MSMARNISPNSILRIRQTTTVEELANPEITSVVMKDDANLELVRQLDEKIKTAYVTSTYGIMRTLIEETPRHMAIVLVDVNGGFVGVLRKERVENKRESMFGTSPDFRYIHNFSSANVLKNLLMNVTATSTRLLRRANAMRPSGTPVPELNFDTMAQSPSTTIFKF